MTKKFLFDTSFEGPLDGDDAEQTERRRPKYFDEDLERARQEGVAAGREAGERETRQTIEQQTVQTLGTITQQLTGLAQIQAEAVERQRQESLQAALMIVRKLFPSLTENRGLAEIEALVADCLERVRDEPRIVIRVCDALLDPVQQQVGDLAARTGFEGRFVLLAQDDLSAGDARVEWADGGAERDSARLWREIDGVIDRTMGAEFTSRVRAALSEARLPAQPPAQAPVESPVTSETTSEAEPPTEAAHMSETASEAPPAAASA